jgi:uncharacterized membrane protein YfcA
MEQLSYIQLAAIAAIFVWSGFVRSGLGFGGAALALPLLLLIVDDPLLFLPLVAIHLLLFSSLIAYSSHKKTKAKRAAGEKVEGTIDWKYLSHSLKIMIIPKIIGVFGLLTLPATVVSAIIFAITFVYSLTYIFNKPFKSNNPYLDNFFLMLGGYISGTSLVGAPLIIAVFSTHVARHQLRDTLFVLWFILVVIKVGSFFLTGVDMQWIHHLWLLPCVFVGHYAGLYFHEKLQQTDPVTFYRVLGVILLLITSIGLWRSF